MDLGETVAWGETVALVRRRWVRGEQGRCSTRWPFRACHAGGWDVPAVSGRLHPLRRPADRMPRLLRLGSAGHGGEGHGYKVGARPEESYGHMAHAPARASPLDHLAPPPPRRPRPCTCQKLAVCLVALGRTSPSALPPTCWDLCPPALEKLLGRFVGCARRGTRLGSA